MAIVAKSDWLDKEDWFKVLIQKSKEIESQMTLDIWKRYAECGKLLIETGYKHSLEARGFLKNFMEAMAIKSRGTVTTMLQLGRMNEAQLKEAIITYRSIHDFSHKLPITAAVEEYKKEKAKPAKVCNCQQGNPGFPHCCVLCPYFIKEKAK